MKKKMTVVQLRLDGFGPWMVFDIKDCQGIIDELKMFSEELKSGEKEINLSIKIKEMLKEDFENLTEHGGW